MIFANQTAAAVWKESWCDRCFQPDQAEQRLTGRGRGCMILNGALTQKTPSVELTRGRSGAMMSEAFRCAEFAAKPSSSRPRVVVADVPLEPSLFDVGDFVAVSVMDGDHA